MTNLLDADKALGLSLEASAVFSPSAPVDDKTVFAGRRDQIKQIIDAINQKGQHAIIFGERGVGKTSLSNVLASFLPSNAGEIIAPRINCDAGDSFNSVWEKVFAEVQTQPVTKVGGFAGGSQRARPDASAEIISPDVVRRYMQQLSAQSLPILIIDEFDRVSDSYRHIFADTIKTLSDHAVRATVVLVGVADNVDQLISGHESTLRALVQVKMPRMTKAEIKQVIEGGLGRLGMNIDADALARIALLSQGLPHYAHLIGLHASRAALDELSLSVHMGTLDTAIQKAIEGSQQSIRNAWQKATASPRPDNLFSSVLLACSLAKKDELGTFAAQDVRAPMQSITGKPYDIPAFAQHLNEFSDDKRGHILMKIGDKRRYRYRFSNPLIPPFIVMRGIAEHALSEAQLTFLEENAH